MDIRNYNDIDTIRGYLVGLKEVNEPPSYNVLNDFVFEFLHSDLYLVLDENDKIFLEIDLYSRGDFFFEWPHSVDLFEDIVSRFKNIDFSNGEEEMSIFKKLLECIYFYRVSYKQVMGEEYNLR